MNARLFSCFAISTLCGISTFAGCGYEPPDVTKPSSSGSGQGGKGGSGNSVSSSGQTSSSGQGGSAGQGTCVIGDKPMCDPYTGPNGTDGYGVCHGSKSECLADGVWSPCDTEVLPTYENCGQQLDVNCDGALPCTGQPITPWTLPAPQTIKDEVIVGVATGDGKANGRDGNVFAVGARAATFNPPPGNDVNVLMWRHTPDGMMQNWSDKFMFMTSMAQFNGAAATSVIVLPKSGNVVVAGIFYGGVLDISNTGPVTAAGRSSFLAQFTPTGDIVEKMYLNGGGDCIIRGMSADSQDNIYIAGEYSGSPAIDGNKLAITADWDGFVAMLSSNFGHQWHQTFSGIGKQGVDAIATIDDNHLVVASTYVGLMAVAGTQLASAGTEADVAIIGLNASDGNATWATTIASSGLGATLEVAGLAANASNVFVGGRFTETLNINGTEYMAKEVGTFDSFIAKIPATGGNIATHFTTQASGTQELRSISLDPMGNVVLAGSYSNRYPLPGKALETSNTTDAFVAKTDQNFTAYWIQSFGDSTFQGAFAATTGKSTGDIYVGGAFQGTIAIGQTMLKSAGGFDAFLVQLGD